MTEAVVPSGPASNTGAASEEGTAPIDGRSVLVVVDADQEALALIGAEMDRRYGRDYDLVVEGTGERALERLRALREEGRRVALILAADEMPDLSGEEFLVGSRALHPGACRALLIRWGAWGDPRTREVILRGMATGFMDYYVLKPWRRRDEYFHRTISEFLHEWSRREEDIQREATVVSRRWSKRGHELRSLLARNGFPYGFVDTGSEEGRALLAHLGLEDPEDAPILLTVDGHVLVDPSRGELARALGIGSGPEEEGAFDVVVVGSGPAGLSAAVYAASEGLRTLVVEREAIGGQAGSSSRIRNYLGFARGISGAELAQRAYQQAWVLGAQFLHMRSVTGVVLDGEGWRLETDGEGEIRTKTVVLATGVSYRGLGIAALDALGSAGVFYGAPAAEARGFTGSAVHVIGGGNSAGQAAVHLARYAKRVTLIVRGPSLEASMSRYLIDEVEAAGVEVLLGTEVVDGGGEGRLEWLAVRGPGGEEVTRIPSSAVFVMIGARPRTEWLPSALRRDARGYVLTGEDFLDRGSGKASEGGGAPARRERPRMFETSLSGVFAVGDVRHGSLKRVASAVGEGSVVVSEVHRYLAEALPPEASPRAGAGAVIAPGSSGPDLGGAQTSGLPSHHGRG